jgi:hypothetical protein
MTDLTFNEFQRELRKRDIPPNTAYMMTLIYERLAEVMKSQVALAEVCTQLAGNLQGLAELNEVNTRRLHNISRGIMADGVDVSSVANDPEKH